MTYDMNKVINFVKQGHLECTTQHKSVISREITMRPNSELATVTIKPEVTKHETLFEQHLLNF